MNTEPENFENLRKLLAFKRHEQPPPGYFNNLPKKIWSRIEAEEAKPSWWERFVPSFTLKPSVAYAFGLVVCGALIIGIGSSLKPESEQQIAAPLFPQNEVLTSFPVAPSVSLGADPSSTNPVTTSPLFAPPKLNVSPAGFQNQ